LVASGAAYNSVCGRRAGVSPAPGSPVCYTDKCLYKQPSVCPSVCLSLTGPAAAAAADNDVDDFRRRRVIFF